MTYKFTALALALALTTHANAGDLEGVDQLVCSPGPLHHCVAEGECQSELPADEAVPASIELDLAANTLSASQADGVVRTTNIQNQSREDGYVFLQGVEDSRAYSLVVSEYTGDLTFTVSIDGETASMFGTCKPK